MKPIKDLTDDPEIWTWETAAGLQDGTLLIANLDVPTSLEAPHEPFRRTPEWLHGEGVGTSRAPLVMMEYALRALRSTRRLRRLKLGVVLYSDEGRDARESAEKIRDAASRAKRVLVLRPGIVGGGIMLRRRGNRRFSLRVRGEAFVPGRTEKENAALRWTMEKLQAMAGLSNAKKHISVSTLDIRTERHPMRLPHRATATVLLTYLDPKEADQIEAKMRSTLGKKGPRWEMITVSDRPPMKERPTNARLFKQLVAAGADLDITPQRETSTWPSVAGLVPAKVGCVCGVGPATHDRGTPQESVQRISLIQRTLLLAEFLVEQLKS